MPIGILKPARVGSEIPPAARSPGGADSRRATILQRAVSREAVRLCRCEAGESVGNFPRRQTLCIIRAEGTDKSNMCHPSFWIACSHRNKPIAFVRSPDGGCHGREGYEKMNSFKGEIRENIERNGIYCDSYVDRILDSHTKQWAALISAAKQTAETGECPQYVHAVDERVYNCTGPSYSHYHNDVPQYVYFPKGLPIEDARWILEENRSAAACERVAKMERLKEALRCGVCTPSIWESHCGSCTTVNVRVEFGELEIQNGYDVDSHLKLNGGWYGDSVHHFLKKYAEEWLAEQNFPARKYAEYLRAGGL